MVVKITTALKSALDSDKLDSQLFCNLFKQWKLSKDEHGCYHFGKATLHPTQKPVALLDTVLRSDERDGERDTI